MAQFKKDRPIQSVLEEITHLQQDIADLEQCLRLERGQMLHALGEHQVTIKTHILVLEKQIKELLDGLDSKKIRHEPKTKNINHRG